MALLYVRVSHGRVKAESGYVCYSPWRRILFCCFLTAASVAARADEVIGVASAVRNNVSGSLPTGEVQINVGENVIRNEIVKTASESWTKLVFSDSTNLSVGECDRQAEQLRFHGPFFIREATVDIAKGAFRFATGIPKSAPMKSTPESPPSAFGERCSTATPRPAKRNFTSRAARWGSHQEGQGLRHQAGNRLSFPI